MSPIPRLTLISQCSEISRGAIAVTSAVCFSGSGKQSNQARTEAKVSQSAERLKGRGLSEYLKNVQIPAGITGVLVA